MTANEMKQEVLLYYDKLFQHAAPAYDDLSLSKALTKAQMRVFKDTYRPREGRLGFESSEEARRNIEQLIRSASISGGTISESSSQTGVHPEGTFYDLPSDFYIAIEEAGKTAEKSGEATVKPLTHDRYTNVRNPYKQPYKSLIYRMDFSREDHGEDGGDSFTGRTNKRTELIVKDKTTYPITDYRVRYLATPPDIVCDEFVEANQRHCILDETLHYKIIDEAVTILTASTEPEEYQISRIESSEN